MVIYRKVKEKIEYSLKHSNKIILVEGARQVGKTYIIREVGKRLYQYFNEINLLDDFNGDKIFDKVRNIDDFKLQLSSLFGNKLHDKENTLIFLDEIQVYPHLITMLKFLKDDDQWTYICSGSELGTVMNWTNSIPIGYIENIKMYPLDFEEYLYANGVGKDVVENIKESFITKKELNIALHMRMMDLFKKYLLIGGLPDVVNNYISNKNIQLIRDIHEDIIKYYKIDASKYDKERRLKIIKLYEMIPSTLENKKKRIVIKDIENIKGKTRKNYVDEFDYLINSGIVLGVEAVSNPVFPLVQSQEKNLIKLYLNDVGLLSCIYYKNNIRAILDDTLSINLGTIYENVVAMELMAHGHRLFYYDNKANGEIDYLIDDYENSAVIPIEVKSGKDYKIHSALTKFLTKGKYDAKMGIVFNNTQGIIEKGNIYYMPIYYIMCL